MEQFFTFFRLKDGVDLEEFRKWNKEVEKRVFRPHPVFESFEVFEIEGQEGGGSEELSFDMVESIVVTSMEEWKDSMKDEAIEGVVEEWSIYADASSALTVFVRKVQ